MKKLWGSIKDWAETIWVIVMILAFLAVCVGVVVAFAAVLLPFVAVFFIALVLVVVFGPRKGK